MSEPGDIEVFGSRRNRRREVEAETGARRRPLLGILSLVVAVITVAIVSVGISLALAGTYLPSTNLAYLATGTSVVAVIGGAAAALLGRGRVWGIAAVVLGLLATPLLLTHLLAWVSGLG
jgi:hypothetical protein